MGSPLTVTLKTSGTYAPGSGDVWAQVAGSAHTSLTQGALYLFDIDMRDVDGKWAGGVQRTGLGAYTNIFELHGPYDANVSGFYGYWDQPGSLFDITKDFSGFHESRQEPNLQMGPHIKTANDLNFCLYLDSGTCTFPHNFPWQLWEILSA